MRTSLPHPIPRVGPHTKKWARWHEKCRNAVFTRCMRMKFGICEIDGCKIRAQDWSHLFSRSHIISEPWASLPELTIALCRQHHQLIDRGLGGELLADLRWQAISRLVSRFELHNFDGRRTYSDPIDAARRAVEELDSQFEFDPERLTFTRKEAAG